MPTWQTSASSRSAKRSDRSSLPRSRWRVIVVRAVGESCGVTALVCRRSGLTARATSDRIPTGHSWLAPSPSPSCSTGPNARPSAARSPARSGTASSAAGSPSAGGCPARVPSPPISASPGRSPRRRSTSSPPRAGWRRDTAPVRTSRPGAVTRPRHRARPARPHDSALLRLDTGTPWIDPRHRAAWRRAWRDVSADTAPAAYDDPAGLASLRIELATHLGRTRGLVCDPDEILVTNGTIGGLTQVLAALPPGPVAHEDPGYRAAAEAIRAAGRDVRDLPAARVVTDLAGVVAAYVTPAPPAPARPGHVRLGPGEPAGGRDARGRGRGRGRLRLRVPLRRGAGAGARGPRPRTRRLPRHDEQDGGTEPAARVAGRAAGAAPHDPRAASGHPRRRVLAGAARLPVAAPRRLRRPGRPLRASYLRRPGRPGDRAAAAPRRADPARGRDVRHGADAAGQGPACARVRARRGLRGAAAQRLLPVGPADRADHRLRRLYRRRARHVRWPRSSAVSAEGARG